MENTTKKAQSGYTVDVVHIMKSLWKRAWVILLAGLLVGMSFLLYSKFLMVPQYSSEVRLYINNGTVVIDHSGDREYHYSYTASELSAAQSLVKTYMGIMKGETTMDEVIERSGVDYTPDQLARRIRMEAVDETEIMSVTVTTDDPYKSATIANCIADVLPDRVAEVIEGRTISVVDYAKADLRKVSPSVSKNAIEGFVIGALLAAVVLAVLAVLDTSVHDVDYLMRTYRYPLLAKVPSLHDASGAGSGYQGSPKGRRS